jgi:tetratricopeptide (TPR) repeat protein
MEEGRTEEAIDHYRQALAAQPHFAKAHYNLGTALVRLRRLPEATREYRAALGDDPGFTAASEDLSRIEAYLRAHPGIPER